MSAYAYACVVSSLCPVYFSSLATLRLPPTTLAILSQPTHIGRGVSRPVKSRSYRTVVEQIAPIATVMNATSVHRLQQRTTPNPLSCPGLTSCVSSQSPRTVLRFYVQSLCCAVGFPVSYDVIYFYLRIQIYNTYSLTVLWLTLSLV